MNELVGKNLSSVSSAVDITQAYMVPKPKPSKSRSRRGNIYQCPEENTDGMVNENEDQTNTGTDNKIPPIHQKRLLTFVNHFIITTVSFFNNFAQTCERKLLSCDQKMQKLEAALCILEAKFNSIPGLDSIETTNSTSKTHEKDENDKPPDITTTSTPSTTFDELPGDVQEGESESATPDAASNPDLAKFLKMVQVGVPVPAVKLKMQQEGVDPNLLD